MQLKLRQIILFIASCLILWASELPGGSLLAVAVLLQLSVLILELPFTKQSQVALFKLFLLNFPILLFWGGAHSFVFVYLKEHSYYFALMAACISFILSFFVSFQMFYIVKFFQKNNFEIVASFQNAFNEISKNKKELFQTALYVFLFSFVPYINDEWKIVFALTATLFVQNWPKLMKAFVNS